MSYPQRLPPWLASLLGLGWLLGLALPWTHAGAFRVAETRPRDPRAAALWQHPQVAQALRVWAAVATGIFHLPTDVTITPAPCGRIDGFYDPGQQQLHLCEELLTYYAGVLTPPGGDPRSPAPVVWDATLVSFLHLVGHAVVAPRRSKRRPMRSAWPSSPPVAPRTSARSWPRAPPSSSGVGLRNPRTWYPGGPTIPGRTSVRPTCGACSWGVSRHRRPQARLTHPPRRVVRPGNGGRRC